MKFKIELDEKEINIIVGALYEMPYKNVADVLSTIIKTINEQSEEVKNKNKGTK